MKVAPRAEQWKHRQQGPPQDKGQGCPSFPLPSSQTKVWTPLLVLKGGHRKLFILMMESLVPAQFSLVQTSLPAPHTGSLAQLSGARGHLEEGLQRLFCGPSWSRMF